MINNDTEMSEEPLVSIIVPIYNVGRYLKKCIESILKQTYINIQIVLIDDGSQDNSGEICDFYADRDVRIEVCHTDNHGLVAARKKGLEYAKGSYVGFVDGDDYIDSHMYEVLLQNIQQTDADFVHTAFIEETNDGRRNMTLFETQIYDLTSKEVCEKLITDYILEGVNGRHITPSIWSKLFKTEFIKECYSLIPDEQQYGEDVLCLYHSIFRAKKISLWAEAYYHYIVREKSLSHVDSQTKLMKEVSLSHYLNKIIDTYQCSDELKERFCQHINRRLMRLCEQNAQGNLHIPQFYFDGMEVLRGKKIVLYGAGQVGKDFYSQISKYKDCEIVAWVDKNWENIRIEYAIVQSIMNTMNKDFDVILIAIEKEEIMERVLNELQLYGISLKKVIWKKPLKY